MIKKILLPVVIILMVAGSCHFGRDNEEGNGNIIREDRTVSNFRELEVHGAFDVYLSQGDLQPVRIETDENLIPYVETIQEGDKLVIRNKDGYSLDPSKKLIVHVMAPVYESIEVSGASNVLGQNKINNDEDLDLDISGAGDIKLEVDAPNIDIKISGSGKAILEGETRKLDLKLSGAGSARCFKLLSEITKVDISGAGNAEVFASDQLEANVSGAGSVKYKGGAKKVKQDVSGAGTVKLVD
jgi:hypothetical protein